MRCFKNQEAIELTIGKGIFELGIMKFELRMITLPKIAIFVELETLIPNQ